MQASYISLFTWIWGFDIWLHKAGMNCLAMVEISKDDCEVLRRNFTVSWWNTVCNDRINHIKKGVELWEIDKNQWQNSINKIEYTRNNHAITWVKNYIEPLIIESDILDVCPLELKNKLQLQDWELTAIVWGPPCQWFSSANINVKNFLDDERNLLYRSFVNFVNVFKPKTFSCENVRWMATMQWGEVIRQICREFVDAWYVVSWELTNARDYWVPQDRKRVIIMWSLAKDLESYYGLINLVWHEVFISHDKRYQEKWLKNYL